MRALLDDAMAQGAFGLSTGLTYVPSMYGPTEEIVDLARVVARHGGLYSTHARASDGEAASVEEAIAIGRGSGVRVQYSHVAINHPERWGRAQDVLDVFRRGRADGVDVAYDVYPYDASSSALTQYLPEWVQAGGIDALRVRLADAATRRRAVAETAAGWYGGIPWLWERVVVSQCEDASLVGRTLAALSDEPADLVLRLCESYGNEVKVVLFYRTEEDMLAFLSDPLATVGSDGNAIALDQGADRPHPRHFGCFPRVLGRYVRERGALALAEAVRKMTAAPAERLDLRDRGRLAEGLAADLVAFDADEVADRATFVDPCRPPRGILHVAVGGELVVDGGTQTGARPGRVLRHA
jgi:N-acyl-D-aspartate/D-glutamate deacylase